MYATSYPRATPKTHGRDAEHRRIFNERLAEMLDDPERRMNSPFLNTEQYDAILATVRVWGALTREERRAHGSKAYAWVKKTL